MRSTFGASLSVMEQSAGLMGRFLPGHEWDETRNKLQAFRLFAFADQELGISHEGPQSGEASLEALLGRALALDNFRSIWAQEGVAHYYYRAAVAAGQAEPLSDIVPERTFVPLHAGMGTAFAEHVLAKAGGDLWGAIRRFLDLCRENCAPGWYDNAVEPLGLVVRSLYPHLLHPAGDAMGRVGLAMQRLYWHGVGRSLYFVPMNFMTFGGSHERALRTAMSEAPTREDRANAVAALVWAVTLVNLRQPAVLRNLLRATPNLEMDDALTNGIVSALLVWRHMIPFDCEWFPAYTQLSSEGGNDAALWNRCVARPVAEALSKAGPDVPSLFSFRAPAKI